MTARSLPPSGKMLFFDDTWIESTARLTRRWGELKKFGPVITADKPWEHHCVLLYGGVIEDEGRYRMWYQTFNRSLRERKTVLCYAESTDGIHWDKPELGLCEWEGSKKNNIVLAQANIGSFTVIRDDFDTATARRYKALYFMTEPGVGKNIHAAFSPDGIRWTPRREPVMPLTGDRTTLLHDPEGDVPYVAFTRGYGMMNEHRCRIIYCAESRDFLTWTPAAPMLSPDLRDSWDVQFYGMPAFRYDEYYMGMLQILTSTPDTIHTELVVSRDTHTWHRSRSTFLGLGRPGEWDSRWITPAPTPPIQKDGSLWFFHEGRNTAHERLYPQPRGAIGLAVLPEDRFCGLEAGPVEGILTTKPFVLEGDEITLNSASRLGGAVRIRAELADETGTVIPEFSLHECETIAAGTPATRLHWRENSLDILHGKTACLRIYITDGLVYSVSIL